MVTNAINSNSVPTHIRIGLVSSAKLPKNNKISGSITTYFSPAFPAYYTPTVVLQEYGGNGERFYRYRLAMTDNTHFNCWFVMSASISEEYTCPQYTYIAII
jgi:hypothetical protein